jgi:hypothetical protein
LHSRRRVSMSSFQRWRWERGSRDNDRQDREGGDL